MKKYVFVSLILTGVLLLAGCQHGLYLRFSDKKVVGMDVNGETEGPGGTNTSEKSSLEDETIEPSGEITGSEERDTETSDEQTTEPKESMTDPEAPGDTTEPESRTPDPRTTDAPTTTRPPETTAVKTTQAPTTQAPTTTEDTDHIEANVEHIEIHTLPTKTFYDQYNEIISTEGMTLLATWADGFEKVISNGWSVISADGTPDPRTETEGEQTIYVIYGRMSVSFTVTYRLAEDAPLRLVDAFSAGRVFYQGEYLKHLFSCAYVGSQRIDASKLTYSQERLSEIGTVTVRISYGKHEAERSFAVVSASQFVLTQEDLDWLRIATIDDLPSDFVLTAAWVYEECLRKAPSFRPPNHPLISDIIPESEFIFDPRDFRDWDFGRYCEVTITCRGLSSVFSIF
jgi:hypothetical protein